MSESLEKKSTIKEFGRGLVATLPFSIPLVLGVATGVGNYVNTGKAEYGLVGFCVGTAVYGFFSAMVMLGSVACGD